MPTQDDLGTLKVAVGRDGLLVEAPRHQQCSGTRGVVTVALPSTPNAKDLIGDVGLETEFVLAMLGLVILMGSEKRCAVQM